MFSFIRDGVLPSCDLVNQILLESGAEESKSLVGENYHTLRIFDLSTVRNENLVGIRQD